MKKKEECLGDSLAGKMVAAAAAAAVFRHELVVECLLTSLGFQYCNMCAIPKRKWDYQHHQDFS